MAVCTPSARPRCRPSLPLLRQVRRWTMPKRLASAGQASSSILDCDRIIVPVRVHACSWGMGLGRGKGCVCWGSALLPVTHCGMGSATAAGPLPRQPLEPTAPPASTKPPACPLAPHAPPPQVHQGCHWVCAVIDLANRKFVYYDSLKARPTACCAAAGVP